VTAPCRSFGENSRSRRLLADRSRPCAEHHHGRSRRSRKTPWWNPPCI